MFGNLFIYDEEKKLVAFHSGCLTSTKILIFLSGLTDGFLTIPYLENLSLQLEKNSSLNCSLIHPLFRSSYYQYGWHSIDDDIEDLQQLIDYLIKTHENLERIYLMGHSTGCQDIIHYLRYGKNIRTDLIKHVFLQGPVSDREYLVDLDSTKEQKTFLEKNSIDVKDYFPRSLHFPPLTIGRFRSLTERNSCEDLFSTDLNDKELNDIYGNLSIPICWICSIQDEFIPDRLKNDVLNLIENRLAKKYSNSYLFLEKADHSINDRDEQQRMIDFILQFI